MNSSLAWLLLVLAASLAGRTEVATLLMRAVMIILCSLEVMADWLTGFVAGAAISGLMLSRLIKNNRQAIRGLSRVGCAGMAAGHEDERGLGQWGQQTI